MLHHRWSYEAAADTEVVVLPDGCRDLIVVSQPDRKPKIRVTDFDFCPQKVRLEAGVKLVGYRLRAGVTMDTRNPAIYATCPSQLAGMIESEVVADSEIIELVSALSAPFSKIEKVSKTAGVTVRTLQRQLRRRALPAPDFWRLLGRARRAALALPCRLSLAEIAYSYGYSDQAHMTREFMRWFGRTPAQLRRDKSLLDGLRQPALGNWTGEQISIK